MDNFLEGMLKSRYEDMLNLSCSREVCVKALIYVCTHVWRSSEPRFKLKTNWGFGDVYVDRSRS